MSRAKNTLNLSARKEPGRTGGSEECQPAPVSDTQWSKKTDRNLMISCSDGIHINVVKSRHLLLCDIEQRSPNTPPVEREDVFLGLLVDKRAE
jgi:hypothetical protein